MLCPNGQGFEPLVPIIPNEINGKDINQSFGNTGAEDTVPKIFMKSITPAVDFTKLFLTLGT